MKAADLIEVVKNLNPYKQFGKVTRVVGLTIESLGPKTAIGDICLLYPHEKQEPAMAEVVGFKEEKVLLMPLRQTFDIGPGCLVEATRKPLQVKAGQAIIGKVLDGSGRPLDGEQLAEGLTSVATETAPPNPLLRPRIDTPLSLGIKAIDGLLTVGKGQRVGIFAGSGVGKSTLLSMITRHSEADINVIALIGERGREVKDFIERDLGEEGMKRSVLVVATSDQPALMRIKGAMTATAIAEYFRDQGMHVNLMMDSVTRFAMAQREIGLAIGEPPATKGYTPSVFALLPRLLERSGTSENGSITAFYTVLVDGDDLNEPIADAVRGILDGHLVLDRKLADKGHYPAINVLKSVSRVMGDIVHKSHRQAAENFRQYLSAYRESEDLINIGAYKKGSSKAIDQAVKLYPAMNRFLQQSNDDTHPFEETINLLEKQFT
ncbi:type III secretion system ATPase, FliI/YscN [Alteribacillus persepolensis]|uniref:Type III secretion system ATPase, FliI/YscN n=1 Tax=Alteribacillus persepolensis TaxID=568899 RepID=A0A1G7YNM0_9BACI|nr:flagellar protein export ATPase FliI [Alteribacillus persepolensis]SDG97906.1 type III secretion system ATPase, FliI/YscN [Alteribacillus persepolensis]